MKLEIENASESDRGQYHLVAKNEKGEVKTNSVAVTEVFEEEKKKPKGEAPQLVGQLASFTVEEGGSADFACRLTKPDMNTMCIWYKWVEMANHGAR